MQKKTKHNSQSRKSRQHHKAEGKIAPAMKGPKPKLYGFHAVSEAWSNEERDVQALYVTEQGLASFEQVLKQSRHLKRPAPTTIDKKQMHLPPTQH